MSLHNTIPTVSTLTKETFRFRPKPVMSPDGTTQLVGPDGKKLTTTRAPLELALPYVDATSLVALLENETTSVATLSFLVDLSNSAIKSVAQGQINDIIDADKAPTQELLNIPALQFYAIATAPKAVVTRGIPKEVWATFKVDFIKTLNAHFGVSIDGATKAAKLIADDRLATVKTAKGLLEKLRPYLHNWFGKTSPESQEAYAEIYEESIKKIDLYLESGEQSLIDAID